MLALYCRLHLTTPHHSTPRPQVTSQLLRAGDAAVLQETSSTLVLPADAPTSAAAFYIVRYSSSDRAGNLAVKLRRVYFECEQVCFACEGPSPASWSPDRHAC